MTSPPPPPARFPSLRRTWARHLEGWQPALLAVVIAALGTALALPRAVAPLELPVSVPPPGLVHAAEAEDDEAAAHARRQTLDAEVRALGAAFRAYGLVDGSPSEGALSEARVRLARAAGAALEGGLEPLRTLRAYQLQVFLDQLRRWRGKGAPPEPLLEVGGPFHRLVEREGYLDDRGELALPESVARVMFKKRWNELTGLGKHGLELLPVERWVLASFLVRRPSLQRTALLEAGPGSLSSPEERARAKASLERIAELRFLDPAYPAHLARAVLHERLGQTALALEDIRLQLEEMPDGPWALRARNHLVYLWEQAELQSR